MGATPPASLFEITLGVGDGKDFYDVSLVDGYNIPLVASPRGVSGECNATGCVSDINMGNMISNYPSTWYFKMDPALVNSFEHFYQEKNQSDWILVKT